MHDAHNIGSGASADFGPEKTPWWTEDREAAKHKRLISKGFPSLTRATGDVSAAQRKLLSADAPDPEFVGLCHDSYQSIACEHQTPFVSAISWRNRLMLVQKWPQ